MFGSDTVVPLDISSLDMKIVEKLQKDIPDNLWESVDKWVELADNKHLNNIFEFAKKAKRIQPQKISDKIFRGFRLNDDFQDNMGLVDKGFFANKLKEGVLGSSIKYTFKRPTSFSESIKIAQAIGNVIVAINTKQIKDNYFHFTPEICYIIHKRRNLTEYYTQKEVIVFPSTLQVDLYVLDTEQQEQNRGYESMNPILEQVHTVDYEPTIRTDSDGTDGEVTERLRDDNDSFPFVKVGDREIQDFDETERSVENFKIADEHMCDMIFESVSYSDKLQKLIIAKESDGNAQAIRSIFSKLVEYIRNVSTAISKWIKASAEVQHRSIDTIIKLEREYFRSYRLHKLKFEKLTLNINKGGCPTAKALVTVLTRIKVLSEMLANDNNSVNAILVKLLVKAKSVYSKGETTDLDEFLSDNEDNMDQNILNDFSEMQAKFTGVGITFDESMAAAFEDVLEYRDDTLSKLGYTEDTFKLIVQQLVSKNVIENYTHMCNILNRLCTYLSAVNVTDSGDTDKYDNYTNTIPRILTIVVSIYRTTVLAIREYTTLALSIEKTVVEHLH